MAIPAQRSVWFVRALVLVAIAGAVAAFFAAGLQHVFTLEGLQSHEHDLLVLRDRHPILLAGAYVLLYVIMAALSIPGALIVTLAGGAVFGLPEGVVLASFGSSIGASLAFLTSRFLFRDMVQTRFRSRLDQINRGLERDDWLYLLSLRLVPILPFFLVNLVFGVTAFPLGRFYLVSQIGMFPATIVYVNAGTQIAQLNSLSGILSPVMIGSLLALALVPLAARMAVRYLRRAR